MSNSIYIEHNPFKVQTTFKVNGEEPTNIQFLESIREQRLQHWIEKLFTNLYEQFNGETSFDVTFKGVEPDYFDVQEAVKVAEQQGMSITLTWIEVESSESRLKQIQNLMEEAKSHPIFKDKIEESRGELQRNFDIAQDKNFDVYVAATMSAGKSTLINAMLGCDLLPAANEATTATIAQITDNDSMSVGQFEGIRINKDDEIVNDRQVVNLEVLKEWNAKSDTKRIELEGNIIGIKERENVRLVLTDTPGPNNSQDPEHSRTTLRFIQDSQRNPLILYILNGTQLGTNDDKQVLSEIARIMQEGGKQSKDRFIFVANKMDAFDPEKGESIERALENIKKYLESNEIKNPMVYPVSALSANLLRKRESNIKLTGDERGELLKWEIKVEGDNGIRGIDFTEYMPLTKKIRNNLSNRKLYHSLKETGLPAIESMIDEYIDKYNFPNRVNRAYQALHGIIKIAGEESKLDSALQNYVAEAQTLQAQIKSLKANEAKSEKAKDEMNAMISINQLMPQSSLDKLLEEESKIRKEIEQFQYAFLGSSQEFTKKQAENRLAQLTDDVIFQSNRLINSLGFIVTEAQEITRDKLTDAFEKYVKGIFEDVDMPTPIVEGLKSQVTNLAKFSDLGISSEDVYTKSERVKTGTRTESQKVKVDERSIFNPVRWFKGKDIYEWRDVEVDVYEYRKTELVDMVALWEKHKRKIGAYFNGLTKAAKEQLTEDVENYAKSFKAFMEQEFELKFEQILNELTIKFNDKEKIEAQAAEARAKLEQIKQFADKLDAVLKL